MPGICIVVRHDWETQSVGSSGNSNIKININIKFIFMNIIFFKMLHINIFFLLRIIPAEIIMVIIFNLLQMDVFRHVEVSNGTLKFNYRPIQNLGNRKVYHRLEGYVNTSSSVKKLGVNTVLGILLADIYARIFNN